MRKSETSKNLGHTSDIRASDTSKQESEGTGAYLKIDLEGEDVSDKHLLTDHSKGSSGFFDT